MRFFSTLLALNGQITFFIVVGLNTIKIMDSPY